MAVGVPLGKLRAGFRLRETFASRISPLRSGRQCGGSHEMHRSLRQAQGRLFSRAKGALLQDDKLRTRASGPIGLGRRTAGGGCPYMGTGARGSWIGVESLVKWGGKSLFYVTATMPYFV